MISRQKAVSLVATLALAAVLTGCLPVGLLGERPGADEATTTTDWKELPGCRGAPDEPWALVEGYPTVAFDAAGIVAECGNFWPDADGDSFMGIMDGRVTVEDLERVDAALADAGYQKKWDDFTPAAPSGAPVGAGARDYYLDGEGSPDATLVAIELYYNGPGTESYTAFIDFHSPATRDA